MESLKAYANRASAGEEDTAVATMKINGQKKFVALFSTHPDLDERIRRLA